METKKILLIIIVFLITACSKPYVKLEEPLKALPKHQPGGEEKLENKTQELIKSPEVSQREKPKEIKQEIITPPEYPKKLIQEPLPPPLPEKEEKKPIDTKALVGVQGPILLNVEAMPLSDFIIYALGELLKVPFLIDEEVRNTKTPVTLRMPRALPPEEVLSVIIDYLEKQGLSVEQKEKVLSITKPKIKPAPPPKVKQIVIGDEALNTSAQVAQFVPLKYLRPFDLEPLLRDLVKTPVEIKRYDRENAYLFIGPGYQIKELLEVIKLLDVPSLVNKKIYLIKLTYWQSEEFVKELSGLLEKLGLPMARTIKDPGILFIPVKSLNSVICIFPDEATYNYALEWIKRLDSPEAAGTENKFFIYRPLYSKAIDLAESLKKLITGETVKAITPAQPGAKGTPGKEPPQSPSFSAKGFTISADEKRNLLLITATPSQYQAILQVIKELDKPPKQVLIEATILELTLKDELKFGLEWYLRNRSLMGNFTPGQIFQFSGQAGFTYSLLTDTGRFNLLLNLFASKGLTNILSTPRVMVLDNQAATIQVGTDIPVVTGEVSTAEAAGRVVRSIQYRNTGVILSVKPTIYTEGLLQLEITQEVSEMGTAPPGLDSPTVLVRKITTNVVAGDGETLVLGGLISTTRGKEEVKIPFLGDIPLIGNLFKTWADEERKTELIVLLRPYIIKNLDDARAITEELKERLKWLKD